MKEENKNEMIVFKGKNIRRIWQEGKWFFSVVDIVGALTDSDNPRNYWYMLKIREKESSKIELSTNCVQLKLTAEDGKLRETDCADTEGIFRIIQSIPSKKAEPFKRWLAKVGYERIQEIENPELAQERMKNLYEQKGYPKDWIDKRLRGIAIRQNLTDEWKNRDVNKEIEYAILTNEISKATFGKTVEEYKEFKNLDKENLRDHMDELELIFGMLGEKVTTEITINKNTQGFDECSVAAKQGGEVAGNARKEAEEKIGRPIVSKENYLFLEEKNNKNKKQNTIKIEGKYD
ncbi:MAG: Bro-N domain-containing protein [Nanoarchaeota archaeon]|nr:Bro-N domain-containing protein [Nanoarchaeota archaeon]